MDFFFSPGLDDEKYPWGDDPDDGDYSKYLNSWEGKFPKKNTKKGTLIGAILFTLNQERYADRTVKG